MTEPVGLNIRPMTIEQRRIGQKVLQDFLFKTGDFITKGMHLHMNTTERRLFEQMKLAFEEYNRWLRL